MELTLKMASSSPSHQGSSSSKKIGCPGFQIDVDLLSALVAESGLSRIADTRRKSRMWIDICRKYNQIVVRASQSVKSKTLQRRWSSEVQKAKKIEAQAKASMMDNSKRRLLIDATTAKVLSANRSKGHPKKLGGQDESDEVSSLPDLKLLVDPAVLAEVKMMSSGGGGGEEWEEDMWRQSDLSGESDHDDDEEEEEYEEGDYQESLEAVGASSTKGRFSMATDGIGRGQEEPNPRGVQAQRVQTSSSSTTKMNFQSSIGRSEGGGGGSSSTSSSNRKRFDHQSPGETLGSYLHERLDNEKVSMQQALGLTRAIDNLDLETSKILHQSAARMAKLEEQILMEKLTAAKAFREGMNLLQEKCKVELEKAKLELEMAKQECKRLQ